MPLVCRWYALLLVCFGVGLAQRQSGFCSKQPVASHLNSNRSYLNSNHSCFTQGGDQIFIESEKKPYIFIQMRYEKHGLVLRIAGMLVTPGRLMHMASPSGSVWTVLCRPFHDRSSVPRVVDDREKSSARPTDAGYVFRYHQNGVDPLPRIPGCRTKVARPNMKRRDAWSESQARFGQNDYIDLLGDGSLHPAQLQYHTPTWLRGFPGQHKANELVKLIHYRNLYSEKLKNNSPRRWHELCKRIKYLLMQHNYNKQDEIGRERDLGLWDEQPDYYYKDKSRRSFKDIV